MKVKNLTVPLYGGLLTFIDTVSWIEVKEEYGEMAILNPEDDEPFAQTGMFRRMEGGTDMQCIFLVVNTKYRHPVAYPKGLDESIVAHEAVHIKNYIFDRAGVVNCRENDEPEAYLVQWIVEQITLFLSEIKKENGKNNKQSTRLSKRKVL